MAEDQPSRTIACPTCKARAGYPSVNRYFPFCSERCKMVDLGRWMNNEFAIDPRTGAIDLIDPDEAEEMDLG